MSCFETITDMKLSYSDGCENPAGIVPKIYWIPRSDLASIAVPTAGVTAASLVTITDAHVLKAGKAPIEMYGLYEKSGANSTLEGEKKSKIAKGTLEAFIPFINAQNLGTSKIVKNQTGILLFKGAEGGPGFYQAGTEDLLVDVENIDTNFGTGPTGEKGIKVTFGWYGTSPFYRYDSELPVPAP
ncbi:hypothetical protein ACR79Q_09870 [Sphingobacterium multivorum]|uniref:hypothetical protein n=1 Tax=Sphingobacterium multivorum TaxID=28454 RepID=UPI003DA65A69